MSLGARLQTVTKFVPHGSVIADIGTDHGYLPIELVKLEDVVKQLLVM